MYNIQKMFTSATVKLTVWYLLIVMVISLGFSLLLYTASLGEFSERFKTIEARLREESPQQDKFNFSDFRKNQLDVARQNMITLLIYSNLVILGVGGAASYLWARQTLRPIEEAHEAQARFTSDASHELRTPLAIIQAEIESTLRDKTATKADYKEILESNLEEVNRLHKLSNLLLKLARLETDLLEWKSINLVDATKQAINSFTLSQQKRIKLTTSHKKIFLNNVNPESITELVVILIDNALKYSTPNTSILVSVKKEKSHIYCSVTNQGKGIDEKDINHIFQHFYQAETSRSKDVNSGYGLGLALAKKIINLHKGEITVTSVKNDKTTFTIKFL